MRSFVHPRERTSKIQKETTSQINSFGWARGFSWARFSRTGLRKLGFVFRCSFYNMLEKVRSFVHARVRSSKISGRGRFSEFGDHVGDIDVHQIGEKNNST